MLLNILHTIAITCAVGTNFYIKDIKKQQTIKKQEPNKSAVITHYERAMTINASELEQVNQETNGTTIMSITTTYKVNKTFTNEYFTAQVVEATSITKISPGGIIIGVGPEIVEHIPTNSPYYISQRMIGIRLTPTYANQNTHMQVNSLDYGMSVEQGNYGVFSMMYSTRRDLDLFFSHESNIEDTMQNAKLFDNNSNYDAFMNMIYSYGGYDGSITYSFDKYQQSNSSIYGKYEKDYEIQIMPSKTNYYIIYQEERQIEETKSWTMLGISENLYQPNITITVKADNVITSGGNPEVVDLPGTMFYVLGMPFTFISTAFNLTIFPGTAYEVNLSTLFLSLLATLIFVFIVRIIIGYVGSKQ